MQSHPHAWAATKSRLSANRLTDQERQLFPAFIKRHHRRTYLAARNGVLALWLNEPNGHLSYKKAAKALGDDAFVRCAHAFLHRYRYINFGLFNARQLEPSTKRPRIVILGAGMAGITTARELLNIYHGMEAPEIIVLEGRKRIGGRVFTFPLHTRVQGSDVIPGVDLAAQIITGLEGNPLDVVIRKQLDLPLHFLKNARFTRIYDDDGQLIDEEMDVEIELMFNKALEVACRSVMVNGEVTVIEGKPRKSPEAVTEPQPSLGDMILYHLQQNPKFAELTHSQRKLLHWHLANLEFANAGLVNQLSLHHWDQDDEFEFGGHHCMVQGGYGQVPISLAFGSQRKQPLDIRLGKTVTDVITPESGLCTVKTNDGEEITCDAVVCTVPLGVLKANTIRFEPELPEWKQGAIERLGFGWFNKVVLVFPKRFWNAQVDSFGSLGSAAEGAAFEEMKRGDYFLFWNLYPTTKLPVLVAFTSGKAATEMEQENNQTVVQKAMAVLSKIFAGVQIPNPVEALVTRWSADEYARGSYSFIANGSTGDDYDIMAKPVGKKLYFAGEATCRQYPATVHGAMISGFRAASSIADELLGPVSCLKEHEKVEGDAYVCTRPGCTVEIVGSVFDHLPSHAEADQISEVTEALLTVPVIKEEVAEVVDDGVQLPEFPKRPIVSSFLLFRNDHYAQAKARVEQEDPENATTHEYLKMLSRMWSEYPPEKKKVYEDRIKEMWREYEVKLQHWREAHGQIADQPKKKPKFLDL